MSELKSYNDISDYVLDPEVAKGGFEQAGSVFASKEHGALWATNGMVAVKSPCAGIAEDKLIEPDVVRSAVSDGEKVSDVKGTNDGFPLVWKSIKGLPDTVLAMDLEVLRALVELADEHGTDGKVVLGFDHEGKSVTKKPLRVAFKVDGGEIFTAIGMPDTPRDDVSEELDAMTWFDQESSSVPVSKPKKKQKPVDATGFDDACDKLQSKLEDMASHHTTWNKLSAAGKKAAFMKLYNKTAACLKEHYAGDVDKESRLNWFRDKYEEIFNGKA